MCIIIYDNKTKPHGIDDKKYCCVKSKQELLSKCNVASNSETVIAIHIGEEAEDELIKLSIDIINAYSFRLVLFSGGGNAEPLRIASRVNLNKQKHVWGYSSRELTRRLSVDNFSVKELFLDDRLDLSCKLLSILWLLSISPDADKGQLVQEAKNCYYTIVDKGSPHVNNPWSKGNLTSNSFGKWLSGYKENVEMNDDVMKLRDCLMKWSSAV